jgi:hypothetical protein
VSQWLRDPPDPDKVIVCNPEALQNRPEQGPTVLAYPIHVYSVSRQGVEGNRIADAEGNAVRPVLGPAVVAEIMMFGE